MLLPEMGTRAGSLLGPREGRTAFPLTCQEAELWWGWQLPKALLCCWQSCWLESGCFEIGTESNPATPWFPPQHCYSTVPPTTGFTQQL